MGVRDFVESKMTVTHAMLAAVYALLAADIFLREGPILGDYMTDLIAMAIFLVVLYINRKLDKGHDELMAEIKNAQSYADGYRLARDQTVPSWIREQVNLVIKDLRKHTDDKSVDRPGEHEGSDEGIGHDSGETTSDSGRVPEVDSTGVHGLERLQ